MTVRTTRAALLAAAVVALVGTLGATAVAAQAGPVGSGSAGAPAAGTGTGGCCVDNGRAAAPAGWVGTFDGFPGASWAAAWGQSPEKAWGLGGDLTAVSDPSSPAGAVLDARYGAHSSAHSCTNCPTTGGGEFYTQLRQLGHADWTTSPTLDLKYFVKFPAGFDFGKAGKLPGLYGGKIGEESGGVHGNGFSTRYMWRKPSNGEVYFYSPTGSGFGKDLGLGKWKFAADGRWHGVEQLVDRAGQKITIWYDGRQVFSTSVTGISGIPFSGLFFSTFFGGHDKSWGPSKTVHASFADFSLSVAVQH